MWHKQATRLSPSIGGFTTKPQLLPPITCRHNQDGPRCFPQSAGGIQVSRDLGECLPQHWQIVDNGQYSFQKHAAYTSTHVLAGCRRTVYDCFSPHTGAIQGFSRAGIGPCNGVYSKSGSPSDATTRIPRLDNEEGTTRYQRQQALEDFGDRTTHSVRKGRAYHCGISGKLRPRRHQTTPEWIHTENRAHKTWAEPEPGARLHTSAAGIRCEGRDGHSENSNRT